MATDNYTTAHSDDDAADRAEIEAYGKRLQEARDHAKYWKHEEDLSRNRLIALMGRNSILEFPDFFITSFDHEQHRLVPDRVRDQYPDVAEICTEVKVHTRIEIRRKDEGGTRKRAGEPSQPKVPSPRQKLDSPGYINSLIDEMRKNLPPDEAIES